MQIGLTKLSFTAVFLLAACQPLGAHDPSYKASLLDTKDFDYYKSNLSDSQFMLLNPDPAWWDLFKDATLSSLSRRLVAQNISVQLATARVAQSRALQKINGAGRFPSLNFGMSYSRQQMSTRMYRKIISGFSKNLPDTILPEVQTLARELEIPTINMWQDELDASWEIDLWGRVRQQYLSAKAAMQVSEEERRAVLVGQLAELARDYISLRGYQTQLRITQDNLRIARLFVDITEERRQHGLVSELDVQSARAQYNIVQSRVPQLQIAVAQYINALSLLLGESPGALGAELNTVTPIPLSPPWVPVGIPSELARRRPDIRAAEANLHRAIAQTGQARADFYPRLTLGAGFGFQALSLGDLGFWNSRIWNIGPRVTLPIFQGKRLTGQLELRKAQEQEAALAFRQTVLAAWEDVDNALKAYHEEKIRNDSLREAVQANKRSLDLAREQYKEGILPFLDVLTVEKTLLQSQLDLADSTSRISINLVQLYNALGGGWEETYPDLPPAKEAKK